MEILRYILLAFIIFSLPTYLVETFGEGLGAISSAFMFGLLLVYYFLGEKRKLIYSLLFLGIAYFLISGLVIIYDFQFLFVTFIKYVIFIIVGAEVVRKSDINSTYIFLILGALSVIIHAVFFQDNYGRYSGFYLNPNSAALIAALGYSFCFKIENTIWKSIGLLAFTFAGIITFSRYFMIMWLLLSVIAIVVKRKNLVSFGIGFGGLILALSFAVFLKLNLYRFGAIENIFNNQTGQFIRMFSRESRFDTWSVYYNMIYDNLLWGNGFNSLAGSEFVISGVHNTFLLTLGEAGIIPFLLMIYIFINLAIKSFFRVKNNLYLFLLSLSLIAYLFVSHNFYDNYVVLFFAIWLHIKLNEDSSEYLSVIEEKKE